MTRFALMFLTVSACIGQGCDLGLQSREEAESESAKNLRIEIGNVVNLKGGELIAGQQAIVVLMFKNISPERMVLPFVDFLRISVIVTTGFGFKLPVVGA